MHLIHSDAIARVFASQTSRPKELGLRGGS
jgi:hypothetical protein